MAEASGLPRDEGLRSLTWSYDFAPDKQNEMGLPQIEGDCDLDEVALEMNGFDIATGAPSPRFLRTEKRRNNSLWLPPAFRFHY